MASHTEQEGVYPDPWAAFDRSLDALEGKVRDCVTLTEDLSVKNMEVYNGIIRLRGLRDELRREREGTRWVIPGEPHAVFQ